MSRLLAFLRATIAGGFTFLCLYLLATPFVVHARLTGRIQPLYSVALWIVRNALRLAGVTIVVTGRENLPQRTCVYMANHQSNIDPPILFVALPPRIAMMGKKQVFSIPVLGGALRAGEFVPVHRENPEEARESVEVALEKLRRGVSFLAYPEGHRSWDGRLLPFKHGVFVLAIRGGVPIVPITVDGATGLMPKGRWEIYPGVVRVTIHPPVETANRKVEERRKVGREVRAIIASALPPELRGEPPAEHATGAESSQSG